MLRDNTFRLITLGRIALVGPNGLEDESLRRRRRKLALLAVLALADRPLSRELLAAMFWGDEDEGRARHSLSDTLSHLRRVLGRGALAARQAEVALAAGAPLVVDALELAAAARARDAARTVALYTGPFLDGVYVDGSAAFEQWSARERDRLERLFLRACEERCLALARTRDWDACAALAERWLAAAPLSPDAALFRLNALKAPGTREADARAVEEYHRLVTRLRAEYELAPDARVAALAADIAARLRAVEEPAAAAADRARPAPNDGARAPDPPIGEGASAPTTAPAARVAPPGGPRRRARRALAAVALLAASSSALAAARRALSPSGSTAAPAVAVATVQVVQPGHDGDWLGDGLAGMIAADLEVGRTVPVVSEDRVRRAGAEVGAEPGGLLTPDQALAIGRRVGAAWIVTGGLTHGDTAYVLDLSVHDAASGRLLGLYTVSAGSLTALADRAAARVLAATERDDARPRLAGVQTGSLEAYEHFVRAVRAGGEGRFAEERHELDRAIALDSGFVSALSMRIPLAMMAGQPAVVRQLGVVYRRAAVHESAWDQLVDSLQAAQHEGRRARRDALARELVERWPRDPRAYEALAGAAALEGRWRQAEAVLTSELALDSLGAHASDGPCVPCGAYEGLTSVLRAEGRVADAERAARRWIDVMPNLPAAWSTLSSVLESEERYDAAIAAARHAASLGTADAVYRERVVRLLIEARRYAAADSMIAPWRASADPGLRETALDLAATLQRERGELRAATATLDTLLRLDPDAGGARLVLANTLALRGETTGAARLFELEGHRAPDAAHAATDGAGDRARSFAWGHALEAEALAESGRIETLNALADSIQAAGAASYYGRDARLAHHVLGLIAMRRGRYEDAVRELEQARWGASGWTATLVELARSELALGHPRQAVTYLRLGYEAPLDAMGRYVPRSRLDLLMAVAFERAGERDSAAAYGRRVRTAWRRADPSVRRLLGALAADSR